MKLGARLKKEREKRNWSQIYVSKKIGITNAVLSNYERGQRDPDTETLAKLAKLYEVSTDYLLGRTDIPFIAENEIRRIFKEMKCWPDFLLKKGIEIIENELENTVENEDQLLRIAALMLSAELQRRKQNKELTLIHSD